MKFIRDAFESDVDVFARNLRFDFVGFAVEQTIELCFRVIFQFLVDIEQSRLDADTPAPRFNLVFGNQQGTLVERAREIERFLQVQSHLPANTVTFGAHPLRVIERKCVRVARGRFSDSGKQQSHQRRNIRHGPHCRMRPTAQPLLVHNHGHAEVLDRIRIRLRIPWQKIPHEETQIFIQPSLRFRRQCVEYQ